ncbi:MAG: S8 family serine peptidase [Candidatus Daviesbacteria bacterium]|nr:S8 family serine peptidase [Candidatus Daviesbacteria bacterium]
MNKFIANIIFFSLFLAFWHTPGYAIENQSDRVIVKFRSHIAQSERATLLKSFGLSKSEQLKLADTLVLQVPKNKADDLAAKFSKNPLIEYAEKDNLAYALDFPNDPLYPSQWGLSKIEAEGGWSTTHGSNSVRIAITDTGIDGTHPDLAGKIVASVDCTNSCVSVNPTDGDGHGTHVAGIASATTNNDLGVAGVGYDHTS